jgi:hypothetical protein
MAAVLMFALPAAAQKIAIDYDQDADFDSYNTFMYRATEETSMADTARPIHERAVAAIVSQLEEGGMQRVDSDPHLYVTYHTEEQKEMRLNTSSFGYGHGPSWYWDPYWSTDHTGSSTSTTSTYTRGTLIVDIWDAETNNLVFRGSASGVVPEDPGQGERQIEKALAKMAKKFRKMRAKDAKKKR